MTRSPQASGSDEYLAATTLTATRINPSGKRQLDELREFAARMHPDIGPMFGDDVVKLCGDFERVYEALAGIANADTKYPSMPSGFTGDWEVLRDEARAVLTESDDGVWE